MMRRLASVLLVGAVTVGLAGADHADGAGNPDPDQATIDLLSGVDFVPTKSDIDDTMSDPETQLVAIATADLIDAGLRVRAIRALGNYPDATTVTALEQVITRFVSASGGAATLFIRASAYSLAQVDGAGAVPTLGELLFHPSRDVRADAAHAMGMVGPAGAPTAIPLLRARLADQPGQPAESEPQVRWALTEAIRELSPM